MAKSNKPIDVDVEVSSGDAVIASFSNATEISPNVEFEIFTNTKKNSTDDGNSRSSILHGECDENELQYDANELGDSQYVIGVYDPANSKLKLVKNSKFYSGRVNSNKILINDSKLLKTLKRKDISKEGTFSERRNALGEEFGTKKAKKAINEASRNKIDSGMLEDSQIDIIDGIRNTTKSMPNREEMAKMVEKENRVIPPCYPEATNVEDIYPVNEIVPDFILSTFAVDIFFQNNGENEKDEDNIVSKLKYLPYLPNKDRDVGYLKKSIFGRLLKSTLSEKSTVSSNINEDIRNRLQLISFTSLLIGLYFNRRLNRRDKLLESFTNLPSSKSINFILQNFGNVKSKSSNFDKEVRLFNIGPKEEDKLLCYIIILLLTLFEFRLELSTLASDLSLKPSKLLALVRTLGCSVMVANKRDGADAAGSKIAVLRVPFKVPDLVRRFRR